MKKKASSTHTSTRSRIAPAAPLNKSNVDAGRALSAEDLLRGNEDWTAVEIPELPVNGKPGVVFMRPPSVGAILRFMKIPEEDRMSATFDLISEVIIDANGNRMFSTPEEVESVQRLDMRIYTRLSRVATELANTSFIAGEEGNDSSEAEGDGSALHIV